MTTRRLVRIVAAGAAVASIGLGLFGVPSTSAQELPTEIDPLFDIEVEAVQDEISPPGTLAAFDVLVTSGGLPVDASAVGSVVVTLPEGSDVDDGLSTGCVEGDNSNVAVCAAAFGEQLQVVTTTPTTAGGYTVNASVHVAGVNTTVEDNDQFSVKAEAEGIAVGIVRTGDSIELSLPDGRYFRLTVPDDIGVDSNGQPKEGVIVDIRGAEKQPYHQCPAGRSCGDFGFLTKFVTSYEHFTATDPTKPLDADQRFGLTDPCRGLGNDCLGIAFAADYAEPVLTEALPCSPAGQVDPVTRVICINGKTHAASGATTFDTRLLSEDPITLPIGRL